LGTELLRKYFVAENGNQFVSVSSVIGNYAKKDDEDSFPVGNYLSATISQDEGDFESAIKYYEKALLKDPENKKLMSRLYGLYLYQGKFDEAVEKAKIQVELDKRSGTAASEKDFIPYLILSLKEFKEGNFREIPQYLNDLSDPKIADESHIDGVVMPLLLAWSYALEADFKNAFRVIDNITSSYMLSAFSYNRALINDLANNKTIKIGGKKIEINEKYNVFMADIFLEIGNYSIQQKNLEETVIYYRLARYLNPSDYKLTKNLASAFEFQGKYDEAIKIYKSIKKDSPFYSENLLTLALAYHKTEQNEKAEEVLKELSNYEGYKFQSYHALGTIYMTRKEYDQAIKYFNQAINNIEDFGPDHWNIYFNLGVAYDRIDNWNEAERYLKRAVQLFPENPETLNYLAYSWLIRNKNIKQARKMLEAAVIRSGGAPHILDSYGWALYKLGMYEDALPFLEQAALALPYNPVINDHLAELYYKLGRKKEAKYHWKKAVNYFDEESAEEVTLEDLQGKLKDKFGI
jgi:tetratricopeptide (TPR) repeat protein